MKSRRIVIIGGGFAGVKCADTLRRASVDPEIEIVLFNAENHIVFTPLLAEVVGAAINPLDVVVPLRQLLPGVHCRTEEVLEIDATANAVLFRGSEGGISRLAFDHLVLACGNVPRLGVVPGMADHAFALKNVGDAVALRAHVLERLERAETCTDPVRRRWHLSFIIVGGGYSGVEAAGEINDLVRDSARYFRNFRAADASVTLVHSRDELLPEIGPALRAFARRALEQRGIRVLLRERVESANVEGVVLGSGVTLAGGTIVCTVGSSPSLLVETFPAAKENGRLLTQSDLRLRESKTIWAVGDCARIFNHATGDVCAPTGQFAERQGRQCAQNILRVLREEPTRPFAFTPRGQLCSLGGRSAVAEFAGLPLSGFFAWALWRGVYLAKLPTWSRRLQVGVDWAWLLCFPRDLTHLRARETDRVHRAHYRPGDVILRPEEVPAHLLVIHRGEVEILRATDPESDEAVSVGVLGPSSFLGEKALLGHEPYGLIARARTAVEVVVMGRNVLTQLSASLAPLRNALGATLRRRSVEPWKTRPEVFAALRRGSVRALFDSRSVPSLLPTATLDEAGRTFVAGGNDFFYVCDERVLLGIVTMTDWTRAAASGVPTSTPVCEFMTRRLVTISVDDDLVTAVALLREHELKQLPVVDGAGRRQVVGVLRARQIMAHIYASNLTASLPLSAAA